MRNELSKTQLSLELDKWLSKKGNRDTVHYPRGYKKWKNKFNKFAKTKKGFKKWLKDGTINSERGGNLNGRAGRPEQHRKPDKETKSQKGQARSFQKRILQLKEIRKSLQRP